MGQLQNLSTIRDSLKWAQEKLKNVSDAPELDAQWLLLKVLGKNEASWLFSHEKEKINQKQRQFFEEFIMRRNKGEPLAYILGEWGFYGRKFYVNKNVLVPRPATELLVDEALQKVMDIAKKKNNSITIVDIGTGSGCVIITLVLELTKLQPVSRFNFIATDISPTALKVASKNAERYDVADIIEFRQGDMLEPLRDEHVDLIVSNPPYVPSGELEYALQSPTIDTRGMVFEPIIALDGGVEGDDYINQIKECGVSAVVEIVGSGVKVLNAEKK